MDFSGADGWSMYHGSIVPGFPQHPHRGFETVTFVRQGLIDHSDSLGATARFGRGDVQWLTAGEGIVHCEMFPLLDRTGPNPTELFQIWLNLPARTRWSSRTSRCCGTRTSPGSCSPTTMGGERVTVDRRRDRGDPPLAAPPDSWASRPDADLAIWHLVLEPVARWVLPPAAPADTARTLYVFEGAVVGGAARPQCVDRRRRPCRRAGDRRPPEPGVPRYWSCRAGRSVSRWPSTGRS